MIGSDMGIAIYKDSWNIPPIFNIIKEYGDIDIKHMFNTFNMGIGMAIIADKKTADEIKMFSDRNKIDINIIGEITEKAGVWIYV
jgi:phosphoribosylformylglycinamidine cyclo-ligase